MNTLRLGEIGFINALPLALPYDALAGISLEKYRLPPTGLNQAMLEGRLDVSPVSSAFYLRHQQRFTMLEGISISAMHPVQSVLLFLPDGFDAITDTTPIAVPDSSETSIALMQYILYRKTGLKCTKNIVFYPVGQGQQHVGKDMPVLAIGDEALAMQSCLEKSPVQIVDLAEAWQQEMDLPFVFAVWIAQNDWAKQHPEAFTLVNRLLTGQKDRFLHDSVVQQAVIEAAHQQCPHLSPALLRRYFLHALSYNLEERHLLALTQFKTILEWLDNDQPHFEDRDRPELSVELLHR